MPKRLQQIIPNVMISLGALMMAAMISSCASRAAYTPQVANATGTQQLITQLQEAKSLDEAGATDPSVNVPRKEDFYAKIKEADRAIEMLQSGQTPSDMELSDALEVPPRHLTPQSRAELIQQLQGAISLDEQREQSVVSWGTDVFNQDPNAPTEFGQQEKLAQEQIDLLKHATPVSLISVKQALYVPPDPR
jgi:hypothetical protein